MSQSLGLAEVEMCTAVEPETGKILYLPLRIELTSEAFMTWVQPDRTTILDVELCAYQRLMSSPWFS